MAALLCQPSSGPAGGAQRGQPRSTCLSPLFHCPLLPSPPPSPCLLSSLCALEHPAEGSRGQRLVPAGQGSDLCALWRRQRCMRREEPQRRRRRRRRRRHSAACHHHPARSQGSGGLRRGGWAAARLPRCPSARWSLRPAYLATKNQPLCVTLSKSSTYFSSAEPEVLQTCGSASGLRRVGSSFLGRFLAGVRLLVPPSPRAVAPSGDCFTATKTWLRTSYVALCAFRVRAVALPGQVSSGH